MRESNRTQVLVSITIAALVVALIHLALGPALVALVPHARTTTALPHGRDASAAFRAYLAELRALPDSAARLAELERPARAACAMSPERRRALGLLDLAYFPLERRLGYTTVECSLGESLAEHWLARAEQQGLRTALRSAVYELLRSQAANGWKSADPALLHFGCSFAGCFDGEADARLLVPWFLPALRAVLDDPEGDVESLLPAIALVARAGRFQWARAELVSLLGRPALRSGPHVPLLASLATASGTFADWAVTLHELLDSGSTEARHGALQALGAFARRRAASGRAALEAAQLVDCVPRVLFHSDDTELRCAAFDLVAGCGGRTGRELLLGLLDDARVPRCEVIAALEKSSCARAAPPALEASAR